MSGARPGLIDRGQNSSEIPEIQGPSASWALCLSGENVLGIVFNYLCIASPFNLGYPTAFVESDIYPQMAGLQGL